MPGWLKPLSFVAACLLIPILWGWLVNALFVHWGRRRKTDNKPNDRADDQTFSDYQI